uniref:CHK kinase-like domain-containing protein n=1 Tax=Anopheles farauti TaxID=69004 RepID=A0A182QD09_9DIPT
MMEFNKDELSAPAWLNAAFFEHILREFESDPTVQLASPLELRPGTKAGDHFASVMYRTTVRYRTRSDDSNEPKLMHLIMKIKPTVEGLKKDLLDDEDFFGKEMRMYTKVLPEMARLMESIGEKYRYPRLVYCSKTPNTIIILEDISFSGWGMAGLVKSFEDLLPTIDTIAKFHAASVVIEQNDPSFTVQYRCTIPETFRTMRNMTDGCFHSFLNFLSENSDLAEFVEPVERFHLTIDQSVCEAYTTSGTCANVLIHGDFHFKNLLHRKADGGRIVDTMFVDYQMCAWSSQVVDLFYLMYMIPEQVVKNSHRDAIVHRYHTTFSDLLRRLNFGWRVRSLTELQAELLRKGKLELFHYIVFSAFLHTDLSKVDPEAFFQGKLDNPALQLAEFKDTMRTELKRFLHQGIIS